MSSSVCACCRGSKSRLQCRIPEKCLGLKAHQLFPVGGAKEGYLGVGLEVGVGDFWD